MAFDHRHRPAHAGGRPAAAAPAPGRRTLAEQWPVQQLAQPGGGGRDRDAGVHALADHGLAGPAIDLPHADRIQRAFGRHEVGGIRAFVGGRAAEAASGMGARAYATGDATAFAAPPDLHTAAHEAAHVVQQRDGVSLAGGVGAAGDRYERHADAVADLVVRGDSAEALLDAGPDGGARGTAPGSARQRAVAMQGGDGAPEPGIPAGGEPVGELGIVMWDDTPPLRLHTAPVLADDNVAGELPFNTHVQVVKRFPRGWLYVTTAAGGVGYAAEQYIWSAPAHPLPEPTANLHHVRSGAEGTAIAIAERYYGSAAGTWGSDLRFFVNVLAAVNKLSVPSDPDGWRSVQFEAEQFIWVPSLGAARAMHGKVNSGSASYEAATALGVEQALAGAAQFRIDLGRALEMSQRYLGAAIALHVAEDVEQFITSMVQMVLISVGVLALCTAIGSAIPPIGAAVGFQIGMGLLEAMGMYFLAQWIAQEIIAIAEGLAQFVTAVAEAHGDADKLDLAGLMFADTIGTLMGGLVTAVLIWATAVGLKAALKLLSGTALGRAFGATELGTWLAKNMQKPKPELPGGGNGDPPPSDQAGTAQTPEEPRPSPEEPETGATVLRTLPQALQSIYDGLSELAKRQFDNRWERIARDPANPTPTEISRMNAYLKSLYDRYGGYSAGLEAEWNRLQSTGQPTGAKAGDLPNLRTDGDNLLKSIKSAQSAQPQVTGYDALLRRVAAQLDGPLTRMESGALEANDANVQGVRSNLDAIAAELKASQQPGVTAVSQQKTGNGETVDVDLIADNNAKWQEIKNTKPFSTQSTDWVGDGSSQGLKAQVEKLIEVAAAAENAVSGKPPVIELVFTYPGAEGAVGADVAAALRAMSGTKGVTVTVVGVEYTP